MSTTSLERYKVDVVPEELVKRYLNTQPHSEAEELKTLNDCFEIEPGKKQFLFEGGWIVISLIEGKGNKALYIDNVYIDAESPVSAKTLLNELKQLAKDNGMKSLIMDTERNPKVWERSLGFKVIGYKMEADLENI